MHSQKILVAAIVVAAFAVLIILSFSVLKEEKILNAFPLHQLSKDTSVEFNFDYVVGKYLSYEGFHYPFIFACCSAISVQFCSIPTFLLSVGAGTAGCVLSSLLAKRTNAKILLIEAGQQFGFMSKIPLLTTFQQKGLNDWSFLSVPQKHSSKGLEGCRQCLPRGKGLGGSSQLNYLLHFDGHPGDFRRLAETYNLTNWRYENVKPFLRLARGQANEILEIDRKYSKVTEALHDAALELESSRDWVFRFSQYNIKNGLRYGAYQRFLKPALQLSNLIILSGAMAKRIILSNDKRVEGVLVGIKDPVNKSKEKLLKVYVKRELIISAGAYQTPQLLLASGIGLREELKKLNITPRHELPNVGRNLHDHLNQALFVSIDGIGPTLNQRALLDVVSIFNYLTSGAGHLGNFGVLGHVDKLDIKYDRNSRNDTPFSLTFFGAGAIEESALMSISNFKRKHFRSLFPRYYNTSQEGFVLISSCLQPKSRGTVKIRSDNVRVAPLIDPNYLSDTADINCTIRAIRTGVDIVTTTKAFSLLKPRIHWPQIEECRHLGPTKKDFRTNKPSEPYLECLIRHVGLGSHHPGGTSSMGTNASNSVVDEYFRVHGIERLRIIDAGVLPTPLSGNPQNVIVAIAIRAAFDISSK